MMTSSVEVLFSILDETAHIIQEELSITYLEAVAESAENLFHDGVLQDELSDLSKKRLDKKYHEVTLEQFHVEEIRKSYQLAILKGMKENVQSNHQMTPDSIGLMMSYLIGKFFSGKRSFSILDPAVGTGNLLSTILNGLAPIEIQATGVEVDDLLIKLAYSGANLQKQQVQFFNQDSIEGLFIDPVDAVICDLPVGYYPNDVRAAEYELKAEEGHSYAHHLLIEQSIKHTVPGGYLFFLIPNGLFSTEYSEQLHLFLKEHAQIQGILQLPLSMFSSEQAAKSIFILQKNEPNIKAPKQVLLADLPKLSNHHAMENMLVKLEQWFKENK
ncbi:class I SAM-dependent methyltransferase [Bacillus sp. 2205SS5-2]|uniref:class I SAM-dependent methyltransferase n=1 Tax=Bacillus sp. 2205SS5-2 TaxID=3109031 RepID=UPI00300721AE